MSASTGTTHTDDPTDDEGQGAPRVSEREAREVAEEARESGWSKPSFAKELYLGRFDLDLVHPHPRPEADDEARGEAFLVRLREVCAGIDGGADRARGADPRRGHQGASRRSARSG